MHNSEWVALISDNEMYKLSTTTITKIAPLTNNVMRKSISFNGWIYFFEYINNIVTFYATDGKDIKKLKQIYFPNHLYVKLIDFSYIRENRVVVYYLYGIENQAGAHVEYLDLLTSEHWTISDNVFNINHIFASQSILGVEYLIVGNVDGSEKKLIRLHHYQWEIIASFKETTALDVLMEVVNNHLYIAIENILYRVTNSEWPTLVVNAVFENEIIVGLSGYPLLHDNRYIYILLNNGHLYQNNMLNGSLIEVAIIKFGNDEIPLFSAITSWDYGLIIAASHQKTKPKFNSLFFITSHNDIYYKELIENINVIEICSMKEHPDKVLI